MVIHIHKIDQVNRVWVQAFEAFGRSLLLHDPDGLPLQINEHDPDLYA